MEVQLLVEKRENHNQLLCVALKGVRKRFLSNDIAAQNPDTNNDRYAFTPFSFHVFLNNRKNVEKHREKIEEEYNAIMNSFIQKLKDPKNSSLMVILDSFFSLQEESENEIYEIINFYKVEILEIVFEVLQEHHKSYLIRGLLKKNDLADEKTFSRLALIIRCIIFDEEVKKLIKSEELKTELSSEDKEGIKTKLTDLILNNTETSNQEKEILYTYLICKRFQVSCPSDITNKKILLDLSLKIQKEFPRISPYTIYIYLKTCLEEIINDEKLVKDFRNKSSSFFMGRALKLIQKWEEIYKQMNLIPIDQVTHLPLTFENLQTIQERLLNYLFIYLEQNDPSNLDQNNRILSFIVGPSLARMIFKLLSPSLLLVYESLFKKKSYQEILKILIFLRVHNFGLSNEKIKTFLEAKLGEKRTQNKNSEKPIVSEEKILTDYLIHVENVLKPLETSNIYFLLYASST